MPSVPKKILDGTDYLSGAGGRLVDRYYIEDMPPGPDMHIRATLVGGLPIESQPHPYKPLYLLRNKRGMAISDDQAFVDCIYVQLAVTSSGGGGAGPIYSIRNSSVIQQEVTRRAATINGQFGESVYVEFKDPASANATTDRKVGEVPRFVVHRTLIAEARQQIGPITEEIHDIAGSVNDKYWSGKPPRTWMLAAVEDSSDGEMRAGAPLFTHRLTFWHNPETWDGYTFYRDAQGNIPKAVITGTKLSAPPAGKTTRVNGITLVNTQPPVDFDQYIDIYP